jgi:hypothetical protein
MSARHRPDGGSSSAGRRPLQSVMEQLGHTDPKFTLRIYAHATRFSEEDRAWLKAFAKGGVWHQLALDPPRKARRNLGFQWARRVSNLRPLACEASALPLSYAPQGNRDCRGRRAAGSSRGVFGESAGAESAARRSEEPVLEREGAKWTNRQPFNPVLLPLDVYIPPTNSGMDVPSGGEGLRRWGPRERYWG